MDQASASPEASCAHNPVAPRTSSSCSRSVDRSRTGGPPHARSGPQCEPHAAPSNRDSRPSSPAPCRLKAKGYLLPELYSGATGRSGRFNEGLLLRRLHSTHLVREGGMTVTIGRRELLAALGGAVATWPLAARGQQSALPVVGFLNGGSAAVFSELAATFRQGL